MPVGDATALGDDRMLRLYGPVKLKGKPDPLSRISVGKGLNKSSTRENDVLGTC